MEIVIRACWFSCLHAKTYPALFPVVTGYPLGQFPRHASSVGLLRRGITAVSNLGTGL